MTDEVSKEAGLSWVEGFEVVPTPLVPPRPTHIQTVLPDGSVVVEPIIERTMTCSTSSTAISFGEPKPELIVPGR